jgi:hypothetical protein
VNHISLNPNLKQPLRHASSRYMLNSATLIAPKSGKNLSNHKKYAFKKSVSGGSASMYTMICFCLFCSIEQTIVCSISMQCIKPAVRRSV